MVRQDDGSKDSALRKEEVVHERFHRQPIQSPESAQEPAGTCGFLYPEWLL